VLPPLDAPAHSNAKHKTLNKTTVTVDRNEAPIAATTHSANRYKQADLSTLISVYKLKLSIQF